MTRKQYKSTEALHILTKGSSRVAIHRSGKAKITKADKERLDSCLADVLKLRGTVPKK